MSDPFYKYDGWIDRWCLWVDLVFCFAFVGVGILACIPYWVWQAVKRRFF
jgi:hypothetical protein